MATVSVEKFIIDFPEFKQTDRLLIERKLDYAERVSSIDVWGDNQTLAVELMAAHLIALSPMGETARLSKQDSGTTTYEKERNILAKSAACGLLRVI
jgi:hypothetical protein